VPTGRPGISRGHAWALPLPDSVNLESLRRWTRPGKMPLATSELQQCQRFLRDLFNQYRIACATPQPTATEQRRVLRRIRTTAARFLKTLTPESANRLLDCLGEVDMNTKSLLYRHISSAADPKARSALIRMNRELMGLWSPLSWNELPPSTEAIIRVLKPRLEVFAKYLPILKSLANIEVNELVPGSGRWPDPPLANLVAGLLPIWQRVTGRPGGFVSRYDKGVVDANQQRCDFAEWLGALLRNDGWAAPPIGGVVDILRAAKNAWAYGLGAIARLIGETPTRTTELIEAGQLPGVSKLGTMVVALKSALREWRAKRDASR